MISIGNDCPYLTTSILEEAIEMIYHNNVVLGPASDGGAYLIGMDRSAFHAESFQSLSWQQENLLEEFLALGFHNEHSIEFLEELSDVDELQDMLELISLKSEIFFQFIWFCITTCIKKLAFAHISFENKFNQVYFSLRAPPHSA